MLKKLAKFQEVKAMRLAQPPGSSQRMKETYGCILSDDYENGLKLTRLAEETSNVDMSDAEKESR